MSLALLKCNVKYIDITLWK